MDKEMIRTHKNAHLSPHADPESFVRGGPVLTFFLYVLIDEGREDSNTTISGQQNAIFILMALR